MADIDFEKMEINFSEVEQHGEWIHRNDDYNDWYECSNCGYGDEGEVKYDPDDRTPFCPMCGAKMRGWDE